MPDRPKAAALAWLILLATTVGCDKRPDIMIPPRWDPAKTAARAIELYDADTDGKVDDRELQRCPGLRDALTAIDADSDGALTSEEVFQRIEWYDTSGFNLVAFQIHIEQGGNPVEGATVTMTPEELLADTIQPASGTTDSSGRVIPTIDHPEAGEGRYQGLRPGMYRCRISLSNADGEETLPARYNSESELGFEIGPGHRIDTPTVIRITHR